MNKDVLLENLIALNKEFVANNDLSNNDIWHKNNKDGSISVQLRNNLIYKLVIKSKKTYLLLENEFVNRFEIPKQFMTENIKSEPGLTRIILTNDLDILALESFLSHITQFVIFNYSTDVFACCSKYIECSDAGKCLHSDKLYANGCFYKSNLDKGKIFYGKNKNI